MSLTEGRARFYFDEELNSVNKGATIGMGTYYLQAADILKVCDPDMYNSAFEQWLCKQDDLPEGWTEWKGIDQ